VTADPPAPVERLAGLEREWRAALAAELPAAVRLRHELHAKPDLSGEEERTAARVAAAVDDGGHVAEERVALTGRLLRVGPASGPAVVVRAELDALPVLERTGAGFAASNGAMHACGHDVHLAAPGRGRERRSGRRSPRCCPRRCSASCSRGRRWSRAVRRTS
jgi:amidohydrolase